MKSAILFGSTGLVGNHLLNLLIQNDQYSKIRIFTRKEISNKNPKLEVHIIDFDQIKDYASLISGNDCFFSIGTTKKQTPDKMNYINIEYELPVKIAKIAKKNNVESFVYVSSGGANENSKNLYLQNKGRAEREIIKQSFNFTAIIQPSLLLGYRNETRLGESIAQFIFKKLSFLFIGKLRPFKAIPAIDVAKSIMRIIKNKNTGIYFTSDKLEDFAKL
tara:strand:+ start:889 stop:1545 length:657 start_codon:yes stop_codon:yes gene_type:complete